MDGVTVLIRKNGPTFFAEIPDLPGCMTQGDSIQEVWEAIEDARKLWMEAHTEGTLDEKDKNAK